MFIYLALIYGLILFFVHYYSEEICLKCKQHHIAIYSFTAGITVTYIFLKLLPTLAQHAAKYTDYFFIYPFLGFSFHHLIERHIYNSSSKSKRIRELNQEHSLIFFIYHAVMGIVLVDLVSQEKLNSLLFFIPLIFATVMTAISMKEIHKKVKENKTLRTILSLSTLFGAGIALIFNLSGHFNFALHGIAGGTLLYVVVGESIPNEKKGSPLAYIAGVILYALLLLPSYIV